ncbi:MAG: hypothetical protein V3V70_06200 [Candidatus Scalindua sp.]
MRLRDLKYAMIGLLVFVAVGLLVGLGIDFLHFNPIAPRALDLIAGIAGGYVMVGFD